jgi:hypothetical protein
MEHLGNLMGTYENTLGTSHGNISRTKTSQHPTFPQKKKILTSLAAINVFTYFCSWHRLMAGS